MRRLYKWKKWKPAAVFMTVALGLVVLPRDPATATTLIHFTDFESGTSVGTDGRDPGFAPNGASTFDTADGWTNYTESSSTNDNLTIPFGGGSETIGEHGIRVGAGLELQADSFFFGWGGSGLAIALRSPTLTVGSGTANVDWVASNALLSGYYSQTGGASWTALSDDVDFTVAQGALEIALVGNDGVDSNTSLDTVTIEFQNPIPEPSALSLAALGLLGSAMFGWRRRRR